jgi:hypothetical protein
MRRRREISPLLSPFLASALTCGRTLSPLGGLPCGRLSFRACAMPRLTHHAVCHVRTPQTRQASLPEPGPWQGFDETFGSKEVRV